MRYSALFPLPDSRLGDAALVAYPQWEAVWRSHAATFRVSSVYRFTRDLKVGGGGGVGADSMIEQSPVRELTRRNDGEAEGGRRCYTIARG